MFRFLWDGVCVYALFGEIFAAMLHVLNANCLTELAPTAEPRYYTIVYMHLISHSNIVFISI
jgi:hypothetical protein